MTFFLALVLTAPVPRWIKQPPRPPVVRVQKPSKAATFLTAKKPEVSPRQRIKRNISGNKKRRVRRVVYRKPKTVWTYPDKIEVFSYAEFWAAERAKTKALVAWCVGRAVK